MTWKKTGCLVGCRATKEEAEANAPTWTKPTNSYRGPGAITGAIVEFLPAGAYCEGSAAVWGVWHAVQS
jgi:hypothetical protein